MTKEWLVLPMKGIPGCYLVETINHDPEGTFTIVEFNCPDSLRLATEYADWKNQTVREAIRSL